MSAKTGIKRRVEWRAECARCQWDGPWRDRQWLAASDLGGHNVDAHGGADRGEW